MDLAKISLTQVLILFILIFLGFLLTKIKLIDSNAKGTLSNLLVYLVVPAMIINSYIIEYDESLLKNLLICFLISFIALMIGLVITLIVGHFYKTTDKRILKFALIFSNAAYMGFPLIEAMYGSIGLIYASSFVSVFNILMWTYGYYSVSKSGGFKSFLKSILKTPVIYALIIGLLIFFFQIKVPSVIQKPLSLLGNMNTPLSMIITGMIIANTNIKSSLNNVYLWLTILFRLIIIPIIILFVLYFINKVYNIDSTVLQVVIVLQACPVASITSVFAVKFKYNENLVASIVVCTTILSIITLPLIIIIMGLLI